MSNASLIESSTQLRLAVDGLFQLRLDTATSPAKLASQIPGAVESVRILDGRLATVAAAAEREERLRLQTEITRLETSGRALQDEAAKDAEDTAETVNKLYPSTIVSAGVFTVRGQEMMARAAALLGQAESLAMDLKSFSIRRDDPTTLPVSLARLRALTDGQFLGQSAAIAAAAVNGQVCE